MLENVRVPQCVLFFLLFFFACASAEELTITTYYPSPYGVYREMRANQLAVGSGFRTSALSDGYLYVQNRVGIGKSNPGAPLDVTGNIVASGSMSSGSVSSGTIASSANITASGSVTANAFYYSSDRALKQNIQPIGQALSKVLNLQGVTFQWKKDGSGSLGFLAQDVEKEFPDLVMTSSEGIKYIQYGQLVAPLVEAIKEQEKRIEQLEQEITWLKDRK